MRGSEEECVRIRVGVVRFLAIRPAEQQYSIECITSVSWPADTPEPELHWIDYVDVRQLDTLVDAATRITRWSLTLFSAFDCQVYPLLLQHLQLPFRVTTGVSEVRVSLTFCQPYVRRVNADPVAVASTTKHAIAHDNWTVLSTELNEHFLDTPRVRVYKAHFVVQKDFGREYLFAFASMFLITTAAFTSFTLAQQDLSGRYSNLFTLLISVVGMKASCQSLNLPATATSLFDLYSFMCTGVIFLVIGQTFLGSSVSSDAYQDRDAGFKRISAALWGLGNVVFFALCRFVKVRQRTRLREKYSPSGEVVSIAAE